MNTTERETRARIADAGRVASGNRLFAWTRTDDAAQFDWSDRDAERVAGMMPRPDVVAGLATDWSNMIDRISADLG